MRIKYIFTIYDFKKNTMNFFQTYSYPTKKRLGNLGDGGYVIAYLDKSYDCYISAGVSNEESFTRDFLKEYSYLKKKDCYAFDGTIEKYPEEYTKEITFFRKNIGYCENNETTNLSFLLKKYKNIFLKMDIESWEFPWLLNISDEELLSIQQIIIELHGVNDRNYSISIPYEYKIKVFEKLAKHFDLVHVHGNNYVEKYSNNVPNLLEMTYIRKDHGMKLLKNTIPFPQKNFDIPNNPSKEDYSLDFPPFCFN